MRVRWNSGIGSPDGNGAWHAFNLEMGCQGERARFVILTTRQFQTNVLVVPFQTPRPSKCARPLSRSSKVRYRPSCAEQHHGTYRARRARCVGHVEITFEGGNVVWRTPYVVEGDKDNHRKGPFSNTSPSIVVGCDWAAALQTSLPHVAGPCAIHFIGNLTYFAHRQRRADSSSARRSFRYN
ncbi:hypothetical protein OG21DRAFT_973634 [Imleria badia]|nr:hypothetical protein OG21DRAFT_973634 [Imleria badia]